MRKNFSTQTGLIKKSKTLKPFEGIWEQFGQNLDDYVTWLTKDLPHYYNERPTVSFLCAAAWQTGTLIAMEEYVTEKHHDGVSKSGRCDFYISEKKSNGIDVEFEAKQNWVLADNDVLTIPEWVRDAKKDAKTNNCAKLAYAINFIVPEISAVNRFEEGQEIYHRWKSAAMLELKKPEHKIDLLYVWENPAASRRPLESRHGKGLQYWPGLWVVLSCVEK